MQLVPFALAEVVENATTKGPSDKCDFISKSKGSGFGKAVDKTATLGAHLSHSLRPFANGCRR